MLNKWNRQRIGSLGQRVSNSFRRMFPSCKLDNGQILGKLAFIIEKEKKNNCAEE